MKYYFFVCCFAVFILSSCTNTIGAGVAGKDYPKNAKAGHCYAQCKNLDGSIGDWHEVLCSEKLNAEFLVRVQAALRKAGFDAGSDIKSNCLSTEFKTGLEAYQKANKLPIGALDTETLKLLGVSLR